MGAHDLDALEGEIAVRFSKKGDAFTPLGEEVVEVLDSGELVYADSKRIRTRNGFGDNQILVRLMKIQKISFFLSMDSRPIKKG